MSRSKWKLKYMDINLFDKKSNKFWSRSSVIPFFFKDKFIFVHNGLEFKKIKITREKIGFKVGEFAFTKKHTRKIIKKK